MFSNFLKNTAIRCRSFQLLIPSRTTSRISDLSACRAGMALLAAWIIWSRVLAPVDSPAGAFQFTSRRRDWLRRAFEATLLAIVNSHVENFAPGTYRFRDR